MVPESPPEVPLYKMLMNALSTVPGSVQSESLLDTACNASGSLGSENMLELISLLRLEGLLDFVDEEPGGRRWPFLADFMEGEG